MAGLPPTITDPTVTLTWGAAGQYYGYCTIADVQYEFANIEAFTTLTASVIAQEISNAAQEMQDLLDHVYQMPYTGTSANILLTLRDVNAKLATANLIDRYFQGSVPNNSSAAAERRSWAELILHDVLTGAIHWEDPFGDAVARGQLAVYQTSTGATITPNPSMNDLAAKPIFRIGGRDPYRRNVF